MLGLHVWLSPSCGERGLLPSHAAQAPLVVEEGLGRVELSSWDPQAVEPGLSSCGEPVVNSTGRGAQA